MIALVQKITLPVLAQGFSLQIRLDRGESIGSTVEESRLAPVMLETVSENQTGLGSLVSIAEQLPNPAQSVVGESMSEESTLWDRGGGDYPDSPRWG